MTLDLSYGGRSAGFCDGEWGIIMLMLVRLIDAISEFTGRLAAWMFFAIGLFVTYEVVMRHFFIAPTIWVDEVSRIMQVWAAYLAGAFALKRRDMITIDVAFTDPASLARKLVESFALLVMLLFAGVATYYGFALWLKSTLAGHTTDSFLAPPKWLTHASVWVGFGLLCLQGLAELYKIWTTGIPIGGADPLGGAH